MNLALVKELFAGFLRTRHFGRHFRRLALLESLAETKVSRELPPSLAQALIAAATSEPDALLARLESHADGLSAGRAEQVRQRVGPNEVEHEKPLPWWVHLWHCYKTPFNLLLTLLAVDLVPDRGREGHHRDRHDGRAVDAHPLLAGDASPTRRPKSSRRW